MQVEQFLKDHGIPYSTTHKNVREDWIGMDCPFCGTHDKYHLGYSLDEDYFSCWHCGGKSHVRVVSRLLLVSTSRAKTIIEQYGGKTKRKADPKVRVQSSKVKFPVGDLTLRIPHRQYLERRGYDPDELINDWDIKGTGPVAKLDGINFSHRILMPIYWQGRLVSFQTRDITGHREAKYITCPPEHEVMFHKHILYMHPEILEKRKAIIVEGILDAWRFHRSAAATFGVNYTVQQVRVIASLFDQAVIVFDPDEAAQEQAEKLKFDLKFKNVNVSTHTFTSDPGDLDQDEADDFLQFYMDS